MVSGVSGSNTPDYDRTCGRAPSPPVTQGPPQSPTDHLLCAYTDRGVPKFFVPGGADRAAKALVAPAHMRGIIATGFNVDRGMPETDGPVGAALLQVAFKVLGIAGTLVTGDSKNRDIVLDLVKALDRDLAYDLAKHMRTVVFDHPHGQDASAAARSLLQEYPTDSLTAVELPGRSADGKYRNMRGIDISGFNGPVDELFLAAKAEAITVGTVDGGNEVGGGGLANIPPAKNGEPMQSVVPVKYPVVGWCSNYAILAVVQRMFQYAGQAKKMFTPEEYGRLIDRALEIGAVDGVTRSSDPGFVHPDTQMRTGVDGFSTMVHMGSAEQLNAVLLNKPVEPIPELSKTDKRPIIIAGVDSGNGGIAMGVTVKGFIDARWPGRDNPLALFTVSDHALANYGDLTPRELDAAGNCLILMAELCGADAIGAFCNTLATVLPGVARNATVPVLNLTDSTSEGIANMLGQYGERPLLLGTRITAESGIYPEKIRELSNNSINPHVAAAPGWATRVDAGEHLSTDEAVLADLRASIASVFDDIDREHGLENFTSFVYACTHYPLLDKLVREELERRGLGRIPTHDPAVHMAELVMKIAHSLKDQIDFSDRRDFDGTMHHVTSGNEWVAKAAVQQIRGDSDDSYEVHRGAPFSGQETLASEKIRSLFFKPNPT